MANGPKTFTIRMAAWADATEKQLEALARQSCLAIAERVVDRTPVDTGFLRGSWQPSIGAPQGAAGADDPSGAGANAKIAAVVAGLKPGVHFHMWNNAVYAKRLEFGFVGKDSLGRAYDQKGRYFVTDTVAAWPSVVRTVAARLGLKAS